MPDEQPKRKHPAHGIVHFDDQHTIVFDTVCTKNRIPWLATPEIHELLIATWAAASRWLVGRYVIMPDHVHYFAALGREPIAFDGWVQYWKSQFSKRLKRPDCRWQTDHWDLRMRNSQQYDEKWEYVVQNPIRKKLVSKVDDWPYAGEIHRLHWD